MMKKQLFLPLIAALSISGCGSDGDDTPITTPPIPPVKPQLENVFGTPDPEVAKTGRVFVSIASKILDFDEGYKASKYACIGYGGNTPCNEARIPGNYDLRKMASGQPPAPGADDVFNKSAETFKFEYLLERAEVDLKEEGYQQSIRPDVFNDGYASILDILLVTAEKYDLDVQYHFDEEMGTYWIDSINGIKGMDRSWLPDDDDLVVPFAKCSAPGGWKAVQANGQRKTVGAFDRESKDSGFLHYWEEVYQRLDEFYVQSDAGIMLIPACIEEKELRRNIYRAEQERQNANGGKVIIPEMVINFEWDKTAVFRNIEVTAHNQRSDIFKPGVLTHMDALLSLAEQTPAIDVNFNLWSTQSSGIEINGYVMNYLAMQGHDSDGKLFNYGHQSDAVAGWNYHAGEYERVNDSAFGMISTFRGAHCGTELSGEEGKGNNDNQSIRFTLPGSPCTGGDWSPGSGTWLTPTPDELSPDGDPKKGPLHMGLTPYSWGDKTPYAPFGTYTDSRGFTKNRAYYPNGFGGNALHVMSDILTLHNLEYFELYMNSFFGGRESRMRDQVVSGKSKDIQYSFEGLPPELNYTAKDISSAIAPLDNTHFGWGIPNCKTCHENGANNGHVATEMKPFECAECHGSNGAPQGHGEQDTCGWCHAAALNHHGNAYTNVLIPEDAWNPITDPLANFGRQKKAAEYWGLYTDFPEPASCMTCHPSTNDRFIKSK